MKIMWCDPGKGSGLAWATISAPTRMEVVDSWKRGDGGCAHITGPTEDHRAWNIFKRVIRFEPDVFGMEDFILYPDRSHNPDRSGTEPMRIIAKVEMLFFLASTTNGALGIEDFAGPFSLPRIEKQMANVRLDITTEELKRLKLWRTPSQVEGGVSKDAMAALQHLLHYIKKLNEVQRRAK